MLALSAMVENLGSLMIVKPNHSVVVFFIAMNRTVFFRGNEFAFLAGPVNLFHFYLVLHFLFLPVEPVKFCQTKLLHCESNLAVFH